ncbi:Cupin 4 family protein [Serinicoccus hydrothermalis]|uniref:Cupin 4 family protein n=1 Tax=Serinicoccus hydrothermalis TaxID=1758689 RepID=A0A1B1NAN5_9MICO|nr:cupin domain-containing protein [Serinicoccus hydrothermalis]ANS78489.1 Cupin 4 family protein [Serinicoccus hydrothermalis]
MTDGPQVVRAGRPALTRLLGTLDPDTFAREHWGHTLHLASVEDRGGDDFADLFSLDAVDELVSERGLRTPFLRVAQDGSTLPESAFTSSGGTGAGMPDQADDSKLLRLFADGATIVLQGLHRTWSPIRRLADDLAADLGSPVQVNAYVTPPANQGFDDHYDVHDVFVLQISGTKRWALREPVLPQPLRSQPWTDRRDEVAAAAQQPAYLETTLQPGDCLYLPRGWIHSARAMGEVSTHLTIGVHAWTRHHLARSALDLLGAGLGTEDEVRRSLPLGAGLADVEEWRDDVEQVRETLLRLLRELPAEDLATALHQRHRASARPAAVRPVAQAAAAQGLQTGDAIVLRSHLVPQLLDEGDRVTVRSRVASFTLPGSYRPALERLLEGEPVSVQDLGATGGLDDDAALELARGLLRRGIAVVPDAGVRD